jgi:FlaA1/EpsC-like NDP-sugar epimerase
MSKLDGARILITGGTGSLGTALTERLLSDTVSRPESITVFSRDELKQSEMRSKYRDKRLKFIIGDVRDLQRMEITLQGVDILFNTAAMKRVETCQRFPSEAVKTNLLGTINIVETIQKYRLPIHTVVGVSSDKGCHPFNIYGASKFLQEQIMLAANEDCPSTRFVAVCYGNVLASRGSVIPIFMEQIANNMPLTVRDPNMTRFLITLHKAVDTLLEALNHGNRGEIYVPIIPSASVGDIAAVLIDGRDIQVIYTGKGAGEKMHETLITEEDAPKVCMRDGYYVVTNEVQSPPTLMGEYISSDWLLSRDELRELFYEKGLLKRRSL